MYDLEINNVSIYRRVITLRVMNSNPAYKQAFAFINAEEYNQIVLSLTLRLLMSYIYGAHILDVSGSHTTTHHSR